VLPIDEIIITQTLTRFARWQIVVKTSEATKQRPKCQQKSNKQNKNKKQNKQKTKQKTGGGGD